MIAPLNNAAPGQPDIADAIGFDGFVIEPRRGRLLGRDGLEIAVRPKVFDLLVTLAAAAGTPLTKNELMDRVWGPVHVTEDSLFQAVKDARRVLGDSEGRLVKHVPKRGYLLNCLFESRDEGLGAKTLPTPPPERPSVAVLPFRVLGEGSRSYIAEGLAEEISIALSQFHWLFVLGRASAAATRNDAGGANSELLPDVRYVIEGSVAEADDHVVLRCRLVETATGRHVWQDRFSHVAGDVIGLLDATTSAIAAAIEPRLLRTEIDRVLRKGTTNLDAFDFYLRALPGYYSRTPAGNDDAIRWLEAALSRDPHFALARSLLARCVATQMWLGSVDDYAAARDRALSLAREALNADRSDPQVLALCGHLLVLLGGEHGEGGALLDLSLRMNPNSAEAWRLGGWVAAWAGESELALSRLARAEQLDPLSPLQADVHSARSAALLLGRRFAEAVDAARRSIATTPEATAPRRFLVSALWHLGAYEEARAECLVLCAIQPNSSIRRTSANSVFRYPWMKTLFIDGLRGAGMPE